VCAEAYFGDWRHRGKLSFPQWDWGPSGSINTQTPAQSLMCRWFSGALPGWTECPPCSLTEAYKRSLLRLEWSLEQMIQPRMCRGVRDTSALSKALRTWNAKFLGDSTIQQSVIHIGPLTFVRWYESTLLNTSQCDKYDYDYYYYYYNYDNSNNRQTPYYKYEPQTALQNSWTILWQVHNNWSSCP